MGKKILIKMVKSCILHCLSNLGEKLVACYRNAQFPCTWKKFCNVWTKKIEEEVRKSCNQAFTTKFEVNSKRE